MEYESVREALEFLINVNESEQKDTTVNGYEATYEDLAECNREALYNIADLLGMSDLYLPNIKDNQDA